MLDKQSGKIITTALLPDIDFCIKIHNENKNYDNIIVFCFGDPKKILAFVSPSWF
jgi:hypothetical protein